MTPLRQHPNLLSTRNRVSAKLSRGLCCGLLALGMIDAAPTPVQAEEPVAYTVSFKTDGDPTIVSLLEQTSLTFREQDQPSPSRILLDSRAMEDRRRLLNALRAHGFFAATVSHATDPAQSQTINAGDSSSMDTVQEPTPTRLTFVVDSGPRYTLRNCIVEPRKEVRPGSYTPPTAADLGLLRGQPADSKRVVAADKALLRHAQTHGQPFATLLPRRVIVDHATRTMDVTLRLQPGDTARLGPTTWSGLETVKPVFAQKQLLWQEGDSYDQEVQERSRNALLKTGLFAMVDLRHPEAVEADGSLPVTIAVQERLQRSFSFGAGMTTDQGPKATLGWEHRNLWGEGEDLATQVDYGRVHKRFKGNLGKPDFGRKDQSLLFEFITESEEVEAYRKKSVALQGGLERKYAKELRLSLGLSYRLVELYQGNSSVPDGTGTFGLVSLPFKATLDHSDDLLNPTQGWRLNAFLAPFLDTLENGHSFTKFQAQVTGYKPVSTAPHLVLAGRIKAGMLVGSELSGVPTDERYYTGGNGSIRGYAYQLAGPLDSNGKPLGGCSLLESSVEARVEVQKSVEVVFFLDEGAAIKRPFPDFSDRPYFGAGSGIRYLTPIGPLRLDVAVPLDRRPGIDQGYQIAASIGQAF
ncbi:MAG: BamA/TamA family outer membrane protein [Magnetococcales bacterium]|nr:BamA/TamA family outer membrane protein [Magnetococcales bacterium]